MKTRRTLKWSIVGASVVAMTIAAGYWIDRITHPKVYAQTEIQIAQREPDVD
jgi:hypothetical protein